MLWRVLGAAGRVCWNEPKGGLKGRAPALERQILSVAAWLVDIGCRSNETKTWTFGLNNFNHLALTLLGECNGGFSELPSLVARALNRAQFRSPISNLFRAHNTYVIE
jgi:hypothetical protein